MGNCVGLNNHRYFVYFIVFQTGITIWGFIISFNLLSVKIIENFTVGSVFKIFWVFFMFFIGFVVISLCCTHLFLCVMNSTTYQQIKYNYVKQYIKEMTRINNIFKNTIINNNNQTILTETNPTTNDNNINSDNKTKVILFPDDNSDLNETKNDNDLLSNSHKMTSLDKNIDYFNYFYVGIFRNIYRFINAKIDRNYEYPCLYNMCLRDNISPHVTIIQEL